MPPQRIHKRIAHAVLDYARSLDPLNRTAPTRSMLPANKPDHPARDAQVVLARAAVTFPPPTQAPPDSPVNLPR